MIGNCHAKITENEILTKSADGFFLADSCKLQRISWFLASIFLSFSWLSQVLQVRQMACEMCDFFILFHQKQIDMLGAIIGDIVGRIYEFDNIRTKVFPFFPNKNAMHR